MSGNINIKCLKCKENILVNILECKEGTEIFCPNCETLITLHFEGKLPGQIIDNLKKEIQKETKKISKKLKFKL